MKPIQFLLLFFVFFALARVGQKFHKKRMRALPFIFWAFVWTTTAVVITFPGTTIFLAHVLGIARGADLIVYTGLLLVFYLLFRIQLSFDSLEQEITAIVRRMALEKLPESVEEQWKRPQD